MNYEEGWRDPVPEPVMSAIEDAPARYNVTRIALIDALAAIPIGGFLTLEARAGWADAILAQLPEAPADALARLAELENAVTWDTSCLSCARVLDSSIAEHERAERAVAALAAERECLAAEFDRLATETSAEADAHSGRGDADAEAVAAGASDAWRAAAARARLSARRRGEQP